ncbi:bZIP 2 domain containing protein [Trichuris trichiura]|uniref:BZIP 2 domain containing protein n=1 Tax=Trichuris trichiura TaxID=36087 RepID=A0A077Z988_TRITR|nr:bZIP 2 domain containing protein [Trichuris trichiura]
MEVQNASISAEIASPTKQVKILLDFRTDDGQLLVVCLYVLPLLEKQEPEGNSNRDMPPAKRRLARKPSNLWLKIPHTSANAPTSTPSPFVLSTPDMECLASLENRMLATPKTADVVEGLIRLEADNFLKCSSNLFGLDPISRPLSTSSDSKKRIFIELNVAGQKVVVPLEVEVLNSSSDINAPVELSSIDSGPLGTNSSESDISATVLAPSLSAGDNGNSSQQNGDASTKRIRTREQNKIAAKSYRARKKETFQLLISANQQLQKEKTELLRKVKQLESEVVNLRQRLDENTRTAAPYRTTTIAAKSMPPIVSSSTSATNVLINIGTIAGQSTNGVASTVIPVIQSNIPITQSSMPMGQLPKRAVLILPNASPANGEGVSSQPVTTHVNKLT